MARNQPASDSTSSDTAEKVMEETELADERDHPGHDKDGSPDRGRHSPAGASPARPRSTRAG